MQTFDKEVSEEDKVSEKTEKEEEVKTMKSDTKKDEETDEEKSKVANVPYMQILKWNGPEWFYLLSGAILSAATGAIQPIWALLFADVLGNRL